MGSWRDANSLDFHRPTQGSETEGEPHAGAHGPTGHINAVQCGQRTGIHLLPELKGSVDEPCNAERRRTTERDDARKLPIAEESTLKLTRCDESGLRGIFT